MVDSIFDYQFRIILIGDSTVGKSSLLRAFTEGKFAEICEPTVGVDFFSRLIEVTDGCPDGRTHSRKTAHRIKLQLWDTAGQERFRSITRSYYRNSVGVLLVYDITKLASFEHMTDWLYEARRHIEPRKAVFLLVGCKCDIDDAREVSYDQAKQLASYYKLDFLETSAKSGKNIEKVFTKIAQDIYNRVLAGDLKPEDGWEGIKNGFTKPREPFHLLEAQAEKDRCC